MRNAFPREMQEGQQDCFNSSVGESGQLSEQEISRAKCALNAVKSYTIVSGSKPK